MALVLFNTLSKSKQLFIPVDPKKVRVYTCGPTVYNNIHIGNLRTYLTADILKKVLRSQNFETTHVTNITDVDDKTIRGSIESGKSLSDFTKQYIDSYYADLKATNIEMPSISPRATDPEIIEAIIQFIQKLIDTNIAYVSDDGVYYEISKFANYDKLAGNISIGKSRISNDEYDKESASDFALWKFYSKDDGDVAWDAPFGRGRPGWHIECSAMIHYTLGEPIDIHTGGVDLIFPHHTNEIAQTEPIYGELSRTWLHNEHITVDDKKMAKSLGNSYTLSDIVAKGFTPLAYRYLLLSAHYRQKQNFTWEALGGAQNALNKLNKLILQWFNEPTFEENAEVSHIHLDSFNQAICDDLNTPQALAVLWELISSTEVSNSQKVSTIIKMDEVFGLGLENSLTKIEIPDSVDILLKERSEARNDKNWAESDRIRQEINKLGFEVNDTQSGQSVSPL